MTNQTYWELDNLCSPRRLRNTAITITIMTMATAIIVTAATHTPTIIAVMLSPGPLLVVGLCVARTHPGVSRESIFSGQRLLIVSIRLWTTILWVFESQFITLVNSAELLYVTVPYSCARNVASLGSPKHWNPPLVTYSDVNTHWHCCTTPSWRALAMSATLAFASVSWESTRQWVWVKLLYRLSIHNYGINSQSNTYYPLQLTTIIWSAFA